MKPCWGIFLIAVAFATATANAHEDHDSVLVQVHVFNKWTGAPLQHVVIDLEEERENDFPVLSRTFKGVTDSNGYSIVTSVPARTIFELVALVATCPVRTWNGDWKLFESRIPIRLLVYPVPIIQRDAYINVWQGSWWQNFLFDDCDGTGWIGAGRPDSV